MVDPSTEAAQLIVMGFANPIEDRTDLQPLQRCPCRLDLGVEAQIVQQPAHMDHSIHRILNEIAPILIQNRAVTSFQHLHIGGYLP